MDTEFCTEIIAPNALTPAALAGLIDELYAVHNRIFRGVSREQFAAYVVESPAERTRILVGRAGGRIVGYLAFHVFLRELDGRRHAIFRMESGFDRAHRGRTVGDVFVISEVLRACSRYPTRAKHVLGCFVHPSAYLALGRVAPQVWPRPDAPTPRAIQSTIIGLSRSFGLKAEAGGVCKIGWITRESAAEVESWARKDDPLSRFFIENNPGYGEGRGLLTYCPVSLEAVVAGSLSQARRQLRRKLQLWRRSQLASAG